MGGMLTTLDHVLVCDPSAAIVCVMFVASITTKGCTDIWESGQIPKTMLVSEGHAATGARQIQVPYDAMVTSEPNL